MELKGFEKFDKILNEIKTEAPKVTERFLMLQAEDLKKDVKNLTPVDTRTLKMLGKEKVEKNNREKIYSDCV